jgi:hypothetical protein
LTQRRWRNDINCNRTETVGGVRHWPQLVRFSEHGNEHARYLTKWIFFSDSGIVVSGDQLVRLNVVLKIEELCVLLFKMF